ncbi:MAG: aminotransferase class I/II-fold pyridoxal phosphate-dependent enzyme [Deltaproteobacteria bacterium]|jgi:alanine-synthesizing transaminase|nr:aminotransferase class I/II-fold pyridoxal phosphate-dependent enzyme [Deltaproteobacteria bacterium]MCL5879515.1 aminotransferase class I/II-fold pyridoxal phosphate-dependent enzyme [Deltaproteobacteria bacterium]MDA8305106.1 aminotransferase class I/II-fold pyridoxal phosphate-dependent enzyme [Deltaproteobacteria bacterium]
MIEDFETIKRLPPYVFAEVNKLKMEARKRGDDIIDLGMGNPDSPTPDYIIEKLIEASKNPRNHRYSVSRGIYKLRLAIVNMYKRHYDVDIDPDSEAIVTMGIKEGLSHLMLATINKGDVAFVPSPTYPIHAYSVIIAGGDVRSIPLIPGEDFFENLMVALKGSRPKPKFIILSFPHNPTTITVELDFFEKLVDFAKDNGIYIIHDNAYADLTFDGYKAPSFLQAKGAKDVGVEFFSMSKSYSMAGFRVGYALGNAGLINALSRIKSYLDYGMFQPLQIASIIALNEETKHNAISEMVLHYKKRRDVLIESFKIAGWNIEKPKATMFVWGKIPEQFLNAGIKSLEFSKLLLDKAKVAVSPGIGFGEYGDEYVRFALVENEMRIRQASKGVKHFIHNEEYFHKTV